MDPYAEYMSTKSKCRRVVQQNPQVIQTEKETVAAPPRNNDVKRSKFAANSGQRSRPGQDTKAKQMQISANDDPPAHHHWKNISPFRDEKAQSARKESSGGPSKAKIPV